MRSPIIGSHPAIDFLNTAFAPKGELIETIKDGRTYVEWLVAAGLLDEAQAVRLARRFGVKSMDAAAAEARKVREWARAWLTLWRANSEGDYGKEIAVLNKLLSREARSREVIAADDGLKVIERSHFESAKALVASVAAQLAALITEERPSLIKECAGSACTLWFLDRTKAHRRLFCSGSACGNRAKVAAFRDRQRN